MKTVNTQDAVGCVLGHDITQIIPGVKKGAVLKHGHRIAPEDVELLLSVGKEHVLVWEEEDGLVHEDDAAARLYALLAGENLHPVGPSEGKIEAVADTEGLLKVDTERLLAVNLLPEMMISTRPGNSFIRKGEKAAATRIIPLYTTPEKLEEAEAAAQGGPIVRVLPFVRRTYGLIITGSEVYRGRIRDGFTPLLEEKFAAYGMERIYHAVSDDKPEMILGKIREARAAGCDMIFCTGGMSVDPDDQTPAAIRAAGARVVKYGSPVLPGAMFLISYLDDVPLLGLPGGVVYAKNSMLERVMPRLLADDPITYREIAAMGEGGLL
ncbi:MAG: molybdopterin-binding protein [Lachnospiraceae bacterium]|nr:molybdopterin-binding protein [Lachnospiraceae bacterium]